MKRSSKNSLKMKFVIFRHNSSYFVILRHNIDIFLTNYYFDELHKTLTVTFCIS